MSDNNTEFDLNSYESRERFVHQIIVDTFGHEEKITVILNEEVIIPDEVHQEEDIDDTEKYYEEIEELRTAVFQLNLLLNS